MFTDLLGLCSCHSNNAADPLSNGLLRDDDKWPDVPRVLQMAADNREQQLITSGLTQLEEAAEQRGKTQSLKT